MKLQFVNTDTFGSGLIDFYEGYGECSVSHVDAVMTEGLLGARSNKIGNIPPGFQLRPWDYEKFTRKIIVDIPASPSQNKVWEEFLRSMIGTPYDFSAILGFALPGDWHSDGHEICSAAQTIGLQHCGIFQPHLAEPPYKIDPSKLLLILSATVEFLCLV